ncbi:MAG: type IX secretion system membrane protein PorP/SprF [Flavobacteriales bacterium]|nr:type IX secretion system membrane protein PorP/SprF [Flavobacteriales bacterium]
MKRIKHSNRKLNSGAFWGIFLLVLLSGTSSIAQQLPQFSQYSNNLYVINPAYAGTESYFDVKAANRYQWAGITDAPRTFTLSLSAPFRNPHMAMGGYLFVDNVGPTRRTGAQVSYGWHMNLSEGLKLGLAASVGLTQFTIDGSRITMAEDGDPALLGQLSSKLVVDAKFGAMVYHEKFYAGITLPQLIQNRVDLYESQEPGLSRLEDHYMLLAGYKYQLNDDFMLEPSVLVKYVTPAPIKIDVTLRAHFRKMVWAGVSWRNNDAFVAMLGYEWRQSLSIGYSYDFTTSHLKNYSDGTHEIVLGFKFGQ